MKHPSNRNRFLLGLLLLSCTLWLACGRLAPPVAIDQRDSLAGQGVILTLTNTSDVHLHQVTVLIIAASGEEKSAVIATLAPHGTETVGWLRPDGWAIPSGAKVKVTALDYVMAIQYKT